MDYLSDHLSDRIIGPAFIVGATTATGIASGETWIAIIGFVISGGWLALGWSKHKLAREQWAERKQKDPK